MSNSKRKIAIYSGEIPSTTFIERLIDGLASKGHTIYLFGNLRNKVKYDYHKVNVVGYSSSLFQKFWMLMYYTLMLYFFKSSEKKRLDDYLRSKKIYTQHSKLKFYPVLWHRPEIFHIQWVQGIDDWMWVKDFGIKVVVSLRGAHVNYTPLLYAHVRSAYELHFPNVDGFHAVSEAIAQESIQYGAKKEKIQVVYSGLKSRNIIPKEPNSIEGKTSFRILSVGRAHWKKAFTYALDAMSVLHKEGVDFKYTIVGAKGDEELVIHKDQMECDDKIELTGILPFTDVEDLMQSYDLLLLPSVEEGIANVVLEAMQLGTIVLTTDCGGMKEVIISGKNGFIVPVRDPQAMADAIKHIMNLTESDKKEIKKSAKEYIRDFHSQERMISEMETLYDNVMNN